MLFRKWHRHTEHVSPRIQTGNGIDRPTERGSKMSNCQESGMWLNARPKVSQNGLASRILAPRNRLDVEWDCMLNHLGLLWTTVAIDTTTAAACFHYRGSLRGARNTCQFLVVSSEQQDLLTKLHWRQNVSPVWYFCHTFWKQVAYLIRLKLKYYFDSVNCSSWRTYSNVKAS